jgi:hypothetical protein
MTIEEGTRGVQVFASAVGQYDNVGDTVLRRGFLDALRKVGPLHVYVGSRDEDHLSGLGLHPDDSLYRTSPEWRARLSKGLTAERSLYAFDTGETEVRRSFAMRYLRLAPLLVASRLRGGASAHVGVGVRESSPWRMPIAAVLRLCSVVTWRDDVSRRVMGLGRLSPDWAFALGSPDELLLASPADPARRHLAVAVRASLSHAARERPSAEWVETVRRMAAELDLEPVFIAQIERDGPLAEELAFELGAEAIVWHSPNHAEHEARIREVYRSSRIVLSDRLHALVIAATEGAVPIGLADSDDDKVVRTLAGAGITGTCVDRNLGDADDAIAIARAAVDRAPEIMAQVVEARCTIAGLTDELVAIGRKSKA